MMDYEKKIDLPSCGLIPGSKPSIQIGSMDMRAEKVIYTKLLATEKLLKIVDLCSDASPEELLEFPFADLVYAFIRIRVISTETPAYPFRTTCSLCEDPFHLEANFDEMDVKFLETLAESGDELEPFSVELPSAGKEVHLKYLRAKHHLALEKMQKKRRSKGMVTDERFLVETLAKRTVKIDDKEGREPLFIKFYESMKTKDGYALRDKIKERDFGISMLADGECPHCGEVDEYLVRLGSTFFRPQPGGSPEAA